MVDNAADERQIDRKREKRREDKLIRETVLKTLMADPRGRRYIWMELEDCKVFQQTITFGPGGHAITAFNEGKRARGLKMLADITRLAPEDYIRMTRENSGVKFEEIEDERRDDD